MHFVRRSWTPCVRGNCGKSMWHVSKRTFVCRLTPTKRYAAREIDNFAIELILKQALRTEKRLPFSIWYNGLFNVHILAVYSKVNVCRNDGLNKLP